jgi:glycosyltransferase involved in cell wall biosynthesis
MTIENALVSIVIPVHNGERFLDRTLASARAQTYRSLEIIVIDDGSTDRTAIIVEAAAAGDNRIRLFRTQKSGVALARNLGVSQARGELIAPLDADDLWHPEKVARQVDVMRASSSNVGLVYCWSIKIDKDDFVIQPAGAGAGARSKSHGCVTPKLMEGNFLENSSCALIKRSCLDAVGGYDPNLKPHGAEDWKLHLALSEVCEFAVIPEYLVGYRQWTGSLSRDVRSMAQSVKLVERWLSERWPDLAQRHKHQRAYNTNIYLAIMALNNRQRLEALRYRLGAYKNRPSALLERSTFGFTARMIGLRPEMLRRPEPLVLFQQFSLGKHATNDSNNSASPNP